MPELVGDLTIAPAAAETWRSHPYALSTSFGFNTVPGSSGHPIPDGDVKDIEVGLPEGLVGNPAATP